MRAVVRPDPLKIIEAAHFRAEEVDNDVANIEKYPVSIRKAFDLYGAPRGFLERLRQVVSDRGDVASRPARRDDHHVRKGGFSLKVDRDDLFGLVVFETVDDRIRECANIIGAGFGGL